MKNFGLSKTILSVLMFCAATVVVSPAQGFTTVYNFCPQQFCPDGEYSLGQLVQATDGDFYGTTWADGADNVGTVYKLTPSGTLTVLHTFTDESDGGQPYAGVIQGHDGNFYGVDTVGGGTGAG